jgi:hypothetical protein
MKKSKVMHHEIKSLMDEFQKFFNEHCMGEMEREAAWQNRDCDTSVASCG